MKRAVASISIGLFAGVFACVAHAADIKIGAIYDYTGPFAGGRTSIKNVYVLEPKNAS